MRFGLARTVLVAVVVFELWSHHVIGEWGFRAGLVLAYFAGTV